MSVRDLSLVSTYNLVNGIKHFEYMPAYDVDQKDGCH
jgi:hypothetical protein